MPNETIAGCVIEEEEGFFLATGDGDKVFWKRSSLLEAHVYTPTEVERLRGAFLHHKHPPQRMYLVRRVAGELVIDKGPISFYLASCRSGSDSRHFVGDCIQLTD